MDSLKRVVLWAVVLFAASGCERMFASNIVESVTLGGKALLVIQGSSESLIKKGRINAQRSISARDGTKLDVWVIKARKDPGTVRRNATVVIIHPMMMSKGSFLTLGEELARDGWDVVLPDLRSHGASEGKYITWGAKEKHDIKTVIDSLVAEKLIEPRLYAMGASLGGCVAVQYAAVDSRCKGVLALAPPAGVNDVGRLLFPLATKGWLARTIAHAGQLADFDPADASAIDAAGKLKCPLVLAHGRLDMIVPFDHSRRIYAAASGPRKLISLPLANHVTVQMWRNDWIVEQMASLTEM